MPTINRSIWVCSIANVGYNEHMQKFLMRKLGRPGFQLLVIVALFIILLSTGTVFYHNVEGFNQVDSVYFTAMTMTTVGYGDLSPQTDAGKLFTTVFAVLGVGISLGLFASLFQFTLGRLNHPKWPWSKDK